MAAIYTPNRFAAAPREPAAVTLVSDLGFAAHLLDTTRSEWIAGRVPNEDRYTVTIAERAQLHATLAALGPVRWGEGARSPVPTAAYLAECAAALRGGVPATSRPLPGDCATYRYVKGQGVTITRLEENTHGNTHLGLCPPAGAGVLSPLGPQQSSLTCPRCGGPLAYGMCPNCKAEPEE